MDDSILNRALTVKKSIIHTLVFSTATMISIIDFALCLTLLYAGKDDSAFPGSGGKY